MIDIDSLIAHETIKVEQPELEHDFPDALYLNGEEYQGFQILVRQTMQHPILSRQEEQKYFDIIQNGASDESKLEARNQIILHNQKLVFSIARRYQGRGLELEDLIQEGNLGLIVAIQKFDPDKGFKLSTYATWWIRQAIVRAIEDKADIVRKPSYLSWHKSRILKAREELCRFLGREPDLDELAQSCGMSRSKLEHIFLSLQAETYLDADLESDGDGVDTVSSFISDERISTPAEIVSDRVFEEQLQELLSAHFDKRKLNIINRRLGFDGMEPETLEKIGKRFRISRERVRQIVDELKDIVGTQEASMSAIIEKLSKSKKALQRKKRRCQVCGKALKGNQWQYCSDQCREKIIAEHKPIETSKPEVPLAPVDCFVPHNQLHLFSITNGEKRSQHVSTSDEQRQLTLFPLPGKLSTATPGDKNKEIKKPKKRRNRKAAIKQTDCIQLTLPV